MVRLAPKSDCRMVINRNWRTGDRRITVTGGIWDFNNLGQSPNPHMTMHCNPPYKTEIPEKFDRNFFHDIDIDGIYADYSHSAVRMLAAGTSVSRVTVRNVHGNFYVYAIGLTRHFRSKPRGRFDDIVIENVFASKAVTPKGIGSRQAYPLIWVEDGADVGNLSIRNFMRDERNYPTPSIAVSKDATVERLTVRDCRQTSKIEKPVKFLSISGKVGKLVEENNLIKD